MAAVLSRTVSEVSGSHVSDSSNLVSAEALQEFDDEAIKETVEQLEQLNKTLSKETAIFDKYIKRLDPKDIEVKSVVNVPSLHMDTRGQRKTKGKQRSGTGGEKLHKLNIEQKYDIATRELDELYDEMKKTAEEREKVIDHHKAVITLSADKLTEIIKSTYEYDKDVLRGGINARTGKLLGERVIKFFDDYIKSRDNLMEKLRLKYSTMKVKRQKLISQLKQKEESGEVRHEVDFEQLKIENKQLQEKVDQKNQELLKLKLSSGKTMLVLNSYKQKVNRLTSESDRIQKELHGRTDMLQKIHTETEHVIEEKDTAEMLHKQLTQKSEDYRVPEVMEYVKERASHHELAKKLHVWERKLEIAEMTHRTYQQTWKQLSKQVYQLHRAAAGRTLFT